MSSMTCRCFLRSRTPRLVGVFTLFAMAAIVSAQEPDFSDEVLTDWRADMQEQFGPRWPEVQAILRTFEGYGVFLLDVKPGNVSFDD